MRRVHAVSVLCLVAVLAFATQALGSGITNSGDDLRTAGTRTALADAAARQRRDLRPAVVDEPRRSGLRAAAARRTGTLLVATENNKVYGLDPATGAVKWTNRSTSARRGTRPTSAAATSRRRSAYRHAGVDPATNTAYMTHKTYVSGTSGPARWYMDAINIDDRREQPGFPVELAGNRAERSGQTFHADRPSCSDPGCCCWTASSTPRSAATATTRPGRAGSSASRPPAKSQARWVDDTTGNGAGIWQSGAGLTSDGPGTILLSTGNGGAPSTPTPGNTPPANLGESVVRAAACSPTAR